MLFTNYDAAYKYAQPLANKMSGKAAVAIEKGNEFGQIVFKVKYVPWDVSKRFGWELRCEIVYPMPLPPLRAIVDGAKEFFDEEVS